jgi:taurine dioxygenase
MRLRQVAPNIGIEIREIDVRRLDEDGFAQIYQAFLRHHVVVIPDQELAIEEFLTYSRRFGHVQPHITRRTRHPDYPELTVLGANAVDADGKVDQAILARGQGWHTDTPYLARPAKATQLYARKIPSFGGDTLFANSYAAYDALPQVLKTRIESLEASYRFGGRQAKGLDLLDPEDQNRASVCHPLVKVHPETGRKSLYVSRGHILRIVGLDDAASEALIEELLGYAVQPDCDYRHRWTVGDLVIWDNRCAIHSAAGGYPIHEPRIHWRVTILDYDDRVDTMTERSAGAGESYHEERLS